MRLGDDIAIWIPQGMSRTRTAAYHLTRALTGLAEDERTPDEADWPATGTYVRRKRQDADVWLDEAAQTARHGTIREGDTRRSVFGTLSDTVALFDGVVARATEQLQAAAVGTTERPIQFASLTERYPSLANPS